MLLWKRGSVFVSTEDENLWINSRLMWFDAPRPPEKLLWTPQKYFAQQKARSILERTMPIFLNIVYKCLFTFKGGYAIEICIGMDLALLIQI